MIYIFQSKIARFAKFFYVNTYQFFFRTKTVFNSSHLPFNLSADLSFNAKYIKLRQNYDQDTERREQTIPFFIMFSRFSELTLTRLS